MYLRLPSSSLFFFNDTATTEIYTLSLHDALPIFADQETAAAPRQEGRRRRQPGACADPVAHRQIDGDRHHRSEEHTSELQSLAYLVCRLLLEKKKKRPRRNTATT